MKKTILIVGVLLLTSTLWAADTKTTALTELAATPDDADLVYIVDDVAGTPTGKKITIVNLLGGVQTQLDARALESVVGTSIGNGLRLDGTVLKADRAFRKLDLTADTSISEAQILAYRYICNQGDAGEADLTLPALSYAVGVIFIVEEAQNIEINPPSGETLDLDGATIDFVDSDSTVGSKISATRMQNASGTWLWSLDSIRGTWTGGSD